MRHRLERARRFLFLNRFLRLLLASFAGLGLLAAGTRLLAWLATARAPLLEGPRLLALAAALALLAALASALVAWRRTPDLARTARLAERRFGLEERLSTSLEVDGSDHPLARALREDAEQAAARIEPAKVAPALLTPAGARTLLGSFLLTGVLLALPLILPLILSLAPWGLVPSADAPSGAAGRASRPLIGAGAEEAGRDFLRQLPTLAAPSARGEAAVRPTASGARPSATEAARTARAQPQSPPRAGAPASPGADAQGAAPAAAERGGPDAERPPGEEAVAGAPRDPAADAPTDAEALPRGSLNDGSTNPDYSQASARDQELREYARRREAGTNPGGGGAPVALADAAVAGDATAGYDGGGAQPALAAPAADGNELDLGLTDASGRRVNLERLPDAPAVSDAGAPAAGEWSRAQEPPVAREALGAADLELLRRYGQLRRAGQ